MEKDSALYQLMDTRMHSVMNGIVSSDGEYQAILRKSDVYSGELNIIPLGSHQFPASEPSGNGIFHLQSHHNILWQHTYLISL